MILVVLALLIILGIGLVHIDAYIRYDDGLLTLTGSVIVVVCSVCLVVCSVCAVGTEICTPSSLDANRQRYDAIVYQAESGMYDNMTENGKRELAEQIREWNEDLARGKRLQHNFWIGVFVADIYDELEYIPIELIH